ncbi:MAG TPA: FtsQ-type POTRA domain-containing protein [Candidatus Saccharimonadales bacterium]|nr:FtsQ-type POTRA domain-containing protein [Candidatus Saccharimonadales bacterium]
MPIFSKKKKNKIVQKSWQRKNTKAYPGASKKETSQRGGIFSRFIFWLLLVVFLGICVYLLFFSTFLDVNKINIQGNQDISSVEISKVVERSLEGKYLKYLPKKNFFLVSVSNIGSAVKNNFNRLEVASIGKKFPDTIVVKVVERKAELVWCSGGACYLVDSSGLAYGGANGTEEDLRAGNFLVVVDDSAIPVEIGKTKISPDFIGYIEKVNAMIRDDLKLDVAASYHTPGIASQEVSVVTNEGWTLKISSEYSVDEAKKIIQTLFEKDLNGETRKNLDYLDLRVKGKVYYKTK